MNNERTIVLENVSSQAVGLKDTQMRTYRLAPGAKMRISKMSLQDILDYPASKIIFAEGFVKISNIDAESLYNTPPCYGIYICGKVFKWLKKMGGLSAIKEKNEEKAKVLYDFLDESKLFKGTVRKEDRSLMNVPFVTGNEELDAKFVKEAKEAGLENLKGHRTVGGMRASIYNAMPIEGVKALVEFMKKFEAENL